MKKYILKEIFNDNRVMTTEDVIQEILPLMTKDGILSMIGEKEDKTRIYNRMRTYKSRIENGERKEKTLNEVFSLFGYTHITSLWKKGEVQDQPNQD